VRVPAAALADADGSSAWLLAGPNADDASEGGGTLFAAMSDAPIAAASLAQVYRAVTTDGAAVAVKVRRPNVARNIALDCHCVRLLLRAARRAGVLSAEADVEEMTAEVGAGLFREIDFRLEAEQAAAFARAHTPLMHALVVPGTRGALSTRSVLTLDWVDGHKLTDLGAAEQGAMIKLALEACFLQLLRTGVIHADPHYGNMVFTPAKQLALLDYGLVTSCTVAQQEAMALGILHTLGRRWEALIGDLRALGLLPACPALWVDARTGEPASGLAPGKWATVDEGTFREAFVAHMEAEAGEGRSFSEITSALSTLSLRYRFILPSWLVFVVRAVVTLDGFAAELATPLSAVDEALPHAVRRALTPRTAAGRRALRELCVGEDGVPRWEQLRLLGGRGSKGTEGSLALGAHPVAAGAVPAGAAASGAPRAEADASATTAAATATAAPHTAAARRAAGSRAAADAAIRTRLNEAAMEALGLLVSPDAEGAALRRLFVSLSTPSLCFGALRSVLHAQRAMLSAEPPSRRRELRAATLARARAVITRAARRARALPRAIRLRRRAPRVPTALALHRRARSSRLVRLLLRAHASQLVRSPLAALALATLLPALLLLLAQAAVMEAAANVCGVLARLISPATVMSLMSHARPTEPGAGSSAT